jgi:hypothetical protein
MKSRRRVNSDVRLLRIFTRHGLERTIATMMRQHTIRVIAISLIVALCLTFVVGWDIVFAQYVMSDWFPHFEVCF